MPEQTEELWNVRKLLREGKVQDADDLITKYFAAEKLVEDKADQAPPEKPPRTPAVVTADLLTEIVGLLGNKESLLATLKELAAVSIAAPTQE